MPALKHGSGTPREARRVVPLRRNVQWSNISAYRSKRGESKNWEGFRLWNVKLEGASRYETGGGWSSETRPHAEDARSPARSRHWGWRHNRGRGRDGSSGRRGEARGDERKPAARRQCYDGRSLDVWGGGVVNGIYRGYRGKPLDPVLGDKILAWLKSSRSPGRIHWYIYKGRMVIYDYHGNVTYNGPLRTDP